MSTHQDPAKQALVFTIVFPTLLTWSYFVVFANTSSALQQSVYSVGKVIQFTFPLAFAWYFEKWRYSKTSFIPLNKHDLLIGIASGTLILIVGLCFFRFFLLPSGALDQTAIAIQDKVVGMGLNSKSQFIALSIFYSIGHSLLEEYYWRWFVFVRLKNFYNLQKSVLISSIGFMAHHVIVLGTFFGYDNILTYLFSLGVAIGGAMWAIQFNKYRTLVGSWFSHCLIDAAIFMMGYQLLWP